MLLVGHANPQDNEFTRWLCCQLAQRGYRTWCDLLDLAGGEIFWTDIENVLRAGTDKYIIPVSAITKHKRGVQKEIALAEATERSKGLRDFIIPCKIDDSPYDDLPASLIDRNVID